MNPTPDEPARSSSAAASHVPTSPVRRLSPQFADFLEALLEASGYEGELPDLSQAVLQYRSERRCPLGPARLRGEFVQQLAAQIRSPLVHCTRWSRRVPPRRRAGYQPGQLSEQMEGAIPAEAARLNALEDDLATIRSTSEVFNALEDAILAIGEPRLRALVRLRNNGWSYNRIVEATGLSKTRVAQLVREARSRGID